MILNLLQKTIRVSNGTVLKCLSVTKQISTSQKCYAIATIPAHQSKRDFNKIEPERLYTFMKIRDFMLKFEEYDTSTTRKLNIQEFTNPQIIRNLKLMDWSSMQNAARLKNFKLLSINAMHQDEDITHEDYKEMISSITLNCCKLNDNDIHILLKCLELWPTIHKVKGTHNHVHELLKQIDIELNKRSHHWNAQKTLMYCDTMCRVYNFHTKFVSDSLKRLTYNPSTLTPSNLVQIMYYLFLYPLPKNRVRQLEPYIEDNFDQFAIEELGIISLGFFRSQVLITSETLLCKIMQKMTENLNRINDNELGGLLKVIRYSFISKYDCINTAERLLEAIIPKVPFMANKLLTQLAHFVADSQLYNQALLNAITKRFSESIESARLKDIERMLILMKMFNYPPSDPLYSLIIGELKNPLRKEEEKRFPKSLGFALKHLAVANIYPQVLISYIMSREQMILTYGHDSHNLGLEYLFLDQSIRIEVPDYKGPMLQENVCRILARNFGKETEYSFGSKAKRDIINVLNNAFGCQDVACLQRILPHFSQNDIILCLENDNAIPPLPMLEEIDSLVKRVPDEMRKNKKWIAIIFASETLLIRKTNQFSGQLCGKIRQLKKVGFVPIVVSYVEWKILQRNTDKWEYLKIKIFDSSNPQEEKCAMEAQ